MKKTGIALAILLAAGVAATAGAWYTGQQLEGVLQDKIAEANQELARQLPGSGVQVALASLERGVFSSDVRYRIELGGVAQEWPASELFLIERIEHGPLPLSRLRELRLLPVMAHSQARLEETALTAPLFQQAQGAEPLRIQTTLGYDLEASVWLNVAPMRYADAETSVSFSGFEGEFQGSAERVAGSGHFERLELVALGAEPMRLDLQGFQLTVDRHQGPSGLFLGEQSVALDRLELHWPGLEALVLSKLAQRDQLSQTDNQLAATLNLEVGELAYAGQPLGALRMDWSANDLNAEAVVALADLIGGYAETLESDPAVAGFSPEQEEQLRSALEVLLAGNPSLNLDRLSLKTANAESRLSLKVGLSKPSMGEALPPEALIQQLISRLNLQLDVPKASIRDLVGYQALLDASLDPQAVAMEAEMMAEMAADMAVTTELATLQGDSIQTRLDYTDGQVTLNGQTRPLEEFLAMLSLLAGDGVAIE
ncbi:MAG TPA: YdgA family protein [Pseudomonas sp.]|uniref:YdgA family protein n=1 Tax=Pseudomonas sp. TaxID=306 RepID=UPI002CD31836|nr:YdgA family protein [Pseudomonas sp.]HTO18475.1 YdgA family protein [Pseudomonas sp.]